MFEGRPSIDKSGHKSSLHNSGLHIANISASNISSHSISRPFDMQPSLAKQSPLKYQVPENICMEQDGLDPENSKTVHGGLAIARLFDNSSNSSQFSSPIKTPIKLDRTGHELETIQSQDVSSKATPNLAASPDAMPAPNKMTFACAPQRSSLEVTNDEVTLQNVTNQTSEHYRERLSKGTINASTINHRSTRQPTSMAIAENGEMIFDNKETHLADPIRDGQNDENMYIVPESHLSKAPSSMKKSTGSKRGS